MKAASLLFLRISTGVLIILWGLVKIGAPEKRPKRRLACRKNIMAALFLLKCCKCPGGCFRSPWAR